LANAQQVEDPDLYENYKVENGVGTGKGVSGPTDNLYTITLETFATGLTTIVDLTKPVDVVLVLDVSGSMDFPKGEYTEVPNNTAISYNTVANSTQEYFIRVQNGNRTNYYRVYPEQYTSGSGQTRYRLRYNQANLQTVGGNNNYSTSPTGTIVTTSNSGYGTRLYVGQSRMTALKEACSAFIDEIERNDHEDNDGNERGTRLGNQIAIVKFAGNENTNIGNGTYNDDGYTYNYSQTIIGFTKTENNVQTLKDAVDGLVSRGGTMSNYGLQRANALLQGIASSRPNSSKVVVFFTDGEPGDSGFSGNNGGSTAVAAISQANTTKGTHKATVFSVGVFETSPVATDNVYKYLDAVSSNWTSATGNWSNNTLTITGTQNETRTFYKDASGTVSLEQIFKDIASASGGSASSVPGETKLVDEVSNSFEVPETFTAAQVVVYTRDVKPDGTDWDEDSKQILNKVILDEDYDLDDLPPAEIATQIAPENTVGVYLHGGKLAIVGFNYSKEDSEGADGSTAHPYDGNWVGWRDNGETCAGKELVIEFKIEAKDGVTGGDGTNTNNLATSGVYVPVYDEEGNFTGYKNVNAYPYPQTDLPINIVIVKKGLRRGESATIQIYRAPIKSNAFDPNTGKPAPDVTSDDDWENFTKVILTNTTDEDFADVTKTLLCLDPSFVYRLNEDNWGWGYELDVLDTDTSKQEANPFTFTNTLDSDAVKHAEAVSINIFGENFGSKSYKGSKVQSY
jgi:hypothetical protein